MKWIAPSAALALALVLYCVGDARAAAAKSFKSCESCVGAGFGWSVAKGKCGGFKNRACPAAAAEPAAKSDLFASMEAEVPGSGAAAGGKWAALRERHFAALANYSECEGNECYQETLEHDLRHWKDTGITKDIFEKTRVYNIDKGRMNHMQIIKGKLYRSWKVGTHGCSSRSGRITFHPRCEGIEHTLLTLLEQDRKARTAKGKKKKNLPEPIPDVEFVVNVNDKPQMAGANGHVGNCIGPDDGLKLCTPEPLPLFSFSKPQGIDRSESVTRVSVGGPFYDIMYPAWTFWGGGPYIETEPDHGLGRWDKKRQNLMKAARSFPWRRKKSLAYFRGSRTTPQRDPLVRMSHEKKGLADAEFTKNPTWRSPADTLGYMPVDPVHLEEHCKFKYLFNFKGMAASFRLKHLFLCNALVFHVGTYGDDFVEFFYGALKPWVHYIPVADDMSDAEELIRFAQDNDDIAQAIAKKGYEFIKKNLRLTDVENYWRKLLIEYSKLLKFKVRKHKDTVPITTARHMAVDKTAKGEYPDKWKGFKKGKKKKN